jgi:glycosyltransferase involved in cell wall biosynthesis
VAVVVGGFHASEGDPFAPAFASAVSAWSSEAELVVFPLRYPQATRAYRAFGARVVPQALGDPGLRASPRLWRTVVASIVAEHNVAPFDLVHALQSAEPGLVAALAAKRIGRPLVAHVGGGELVDLPDIGYGSQGEVAGRGFVAAALRAASVRTAGSRAGARLLRARLGADQAQSVRVVPLPVDLQRFRPRLQRERRKAIAEGEAPARLLCVADLNPVKDHATLLEAFGLLARSRPHARLDLVGGGPCLGELRRQAATLGIAERVRWWGQVPHEAVHLAYAEADAFVLASRHEGQGIALLEAAACALPIATTPVGIAPELPAGSVHYAPSRDVGALAQAMAAALDDAPRDKDARRALRSAVRQRWSPRASAARVSKLWRELGHA